MKSHLQKQRELERQPVYIPKQVSKKVKCPICKNKMYSHNLEKYGKCYSCSMTQNKGGLIGDD